MPAVTATNRLTMASAGEQKANPMIYIPGRAAGATTLSQPVFASAFATAASVPTPTPTPASSATPAIPHTVLLIEPDPDCADALETLLSSLPMVAGVDVHLAPAEALAEIAAGTLRPSVVFIATNVENPPLMRALNALEALVPDAATVVLCLYPDRLTEDVARKIDACASKDTCRRDLLELFAGLETLRRG